MSRFASFRHVPSETRRILRDRFRRKLPVVGQSRPPSSDLSVTPDQVMLRLLAGLKVSPNAQWQAAEAAYAGAEPKGSEPPDLEALAKLGWVREIWGRVVTGRDLYVAARRAPNGTLDAFKALLSIIHDQRYEGDVALRSDPEIATLIKDRKSVV